MKKKKKNKELCFAKTNIKVFKINDCEKRCAGMFAKISTFINALHFLKETFCKQWLFRLELRHLTGSKLFALKTVKKYQ